MMVASKAAAPYLGRTPDRVWIRRKPWIRVWRSDGSYALLPIPEEDHDRLARLDGKTVHPKPWKMEDHTR